MTLMDYLVLSREEKNVVDLEVFKETETKSNEESFERVKDMSYDMNNVLAEEVDESDLHDIPMNIKYMMTHSIGRNMIQ